MTPDASRGLRVAYLLQTSRETGARTAGERLADGLARHTDHEVLKMVPDRLDLDPGGPFVMDGDVHHPTVALSTALSHASPDVVVAHTVTEDLLDEAPLIHAMWPTLFRLGLNPTEANVTSDVDGHLEHLPEFVRGFDAILAPGEHAARKAQGLGIDPGRIHVVSPGAPYYTDTPDPSEKPHAVGAVARDAPVKNLPILARAIRYYADHLGDPPTVLLAGVGATGGEDEPEVLAHARALSVAHHFAPLGWVDPTEDVWPEVRAAVLPSLSENFPAVYAEALGAGVPVVAPDAGWAVEPAVYAPDDPVALAEALQTAVESPADVHARQSKAAPKGLPLTEAVGQLADALTAVSERVAPFTLEGVEA